MKSRRNRRGGANFLEMIGIKSATPAPMPEEKKSILERFKTFGKEESNKLGIGIKNQLNEKFQNEIDKLKTAFDDINAFKEANPNKLPDVMAEVSDLGSLTGYSEAALINAIVMHNTAFKMRQLDNTLGSECGPKCAERALSIRIALRKLVEYSERSDALGYIGIGRGVVNNVSYVGNSIVSGVTKAPERISDAATYAKSSLQNAYNSFTRKAPQTPETPPDAVTNPMQPVSGGRRRRTRRR